MAADIPEHRLAARFALYGRGDGQERERLGAGAAGPRHHVPGPRRSASVGSYRRETRAVAAVALLALAAGVVSDVFAAQFWGHHALLSGLTSSVIVVLLSVALVSAQYVMLELVRNARLIWTVVTELAGMMPSDAQTPASMDAAARAVRDTPRLAEAIRGLVADGDRRRRLHDKITRFAAHCDEVLGRWAAVMLNAHAYADVIDRHVELAADIAGLGSLLDYFEPADDDPGQRRKGQSNAAIQIQGDFDDEWLTDRVVAITRLAEQLDRETLQLALRIVPVQWWAARLGDAHLGKA